MRAARAMLAPAERPSECGRRSKSERGACLVAACAKPHSPWRSTGRDFSDRLLTWHATAERPLVIRQARTPWEILVAEVMSQQTGIKRVGPAWRGFMNAWPTPHL